ncbi:hypothetical protein NSPZN2_30459 [Nitrospira defluvii]|uniref:Uncharacterized protein n=1 Tax=Nitrospira defluvii TaxID=330214 RepID=A0ABN7LLD1_9BACT|nr:hypothetical protein NSPZN2_30459 [Nitrospira defluvii]
MVPSQSIIGEGYAKKGRHRGGRKYFAEVGGRCRLIFDLPVWVLNAGLMKGSEETYESLGHRRSGVYRITRCRSVAARGPRRGGGR